jgi:iron complex transport system substrate-binding protein
MHQEWLTRFIGVDYDLDKHGVFVYPELDAKPQTVTITDATGREITLQLPIERVACIHPTVAEGLRIVDAWDKVIAVDNCTTDPVLFPDIAEMTRLTFTESSSIDYEAIIELDPDVLLVLPAAGALDLEATIAALEPEIPVISVFDTYDTETWSKGIALLGTIMQQEEKAQEYIEWWQEIEDSISSVTASLTEEEKPRVFMKVPGWTIEAFCTYSNEFAFVEKAMDMIGAINIAADLPSMDGWVQEVDQEWLMTQDIDYIFVQVWDSFAQDSVGFLVEDDAVLIGMREDTMSLLAFEDSTAVANGDVYMTDTYFLTTLRYPVLMEHMAKALHPELFIDIDPMETLQEYLTRFIRIDHDLDDSGVFFYPES